MKPGIIVRIHELGPIKDAELRLSPMLLITGNSNMGKSYVNYLFYYLMRSLTWDMYQPLITKKCNRMKKEDADFSFKITENDIRKWLKENATPFLRQFLGDDTLICEVDFILSFENLFTDSSLNINYHREFVKAAVEAMPDSVLCTVNVNGEISSISSYVSDQRIEMQQLAQTVSLFLQKQMFGHSVLKSVIMPPARGSYVGENFSAKEMISTQAGMYKYFLNDYDLALHKGSIDNDLTNDEQFFQSRIKTLIKGELITEDNKQYLELNNGKKIPLTAAASSIKELSPFLFFLKNWSRYQFSFCIEEPEAHLHPTMQKDIADLLAACLNKGMYFQMTTHSDYFLQRINQLILLGDFRKKDFAQYEEFRKSHALNQRFYLDRESVSCYFFHEDENDRIKIEELELGEQGLPLTTFFGVVHEITEFGDDLSIALNPEEYRNDQ